MGVAYVIKMDLRKILNADVKLIQPRGTSSGLLWSRNEPSGFKHGRVNWLATILSVTPLHKPRPLGGGLRFSFDLSQTSAVSGREWSNVLSLRRAPWPFCTPCLTEKYPSAPGSNSWFFDRQAVITVPLSCDTVWIGFAGVSNFNRETQKFLCYYFFFFLFYQLARPTGGSDFPFPPADCGA